MAIRYQDENGNWVTGQKAIETKITDQQGNFESDNVEGALRELAEGVKANADVTKLEATIQANSSKIGNLQTKVTNLQSDMLTAQDDIEWLKVNGGGGGGTAVPTITSTFTDTSIDKGSDVTIPIFFSSPNQGNGTAYILVNNIQVDTTGLKQGNNNVRVQGQFLTSQTENLVAIYAKDRAGIVSNQLSWTIVAGGIELTSTFDYEADYGITDTIRIDYNIDTGIKETITLTLDIDNNVTTYTAVNGGNFIDITAADLGLGTHVVKMYATVGKYTSRTLSFNLVIVSTTELYLSSSFDQTKEYTYGVPISVNYRLSKQSTEEFNVYLKIDEETVKTQKLTVGSYYWTIQSLSEGSHTLTIQAISQDYSEDKSITLTVNVVMGEYVPIEDYTSGLICDLNAVGKSNEDDEVLVDNIWRDESGNGHNAKLVNFNYGTNGFVNDTLVCDNDAYAVIEWSPWERNAITGSTIDIIYEPINSGIEDCRVLDYTQITDDTSTAEIKPFKGVYADVLHGIVSSASSGTSAGKINIDDESGEIHLTWVLDRTNKFMKTYINGVLSRIMFLSDSGTGVNKVYEDFSLSSNIYLNSTKGENCGTNNIKRFRVYDHALTSDQVLQNHLANIKDLTKQEEEFNFNYNNTTLPKMYLTGDTTNMTATQTVPMKIEYISPNEEKYGQSFNTGIQNNPVCIQGTSSLQYVRHNYTIYLKDEYGADMLYNPYGSGSKPENVFCLKADYVESSHANNTGMAKFINDCVYDTKTPMQLADSDCRTTINGFPIEVYMNGEYLGVYNFNHDRYSYKSYGYDYNKYPNMLVYEINSNSNTSAGAFYRYGDNAESSANVSELEYYKRDFNLIYGNRTSDSDSYSEIKTLVEWVSVAEQDLFREMISEHFNKEYLFRYFLTVLMIGAVDSLGKNMKIMTIDGQVWYPTFYDLDTVLGIDNSGYLTIEPDVEIESGSYNTSNSNLWSKVWNYFNAELKEEWAKMRQGSFTLDNLMNYIYGEQISKIPAKLYNDDAQVKYLDFGSLYTYCCHGSKEHQIRRWLRERIAYVDSMLGYFTSQEDQVTIRMNKTGEVSFDVTPYIPLYFSVKWSNATGGTQTFKLKRGETKRFYYTSTTSTDQEVIIYHAKYIKRLDNLSNLNPSSCILSNAVKLTNVEIHSSELYNINVTNNKFLRSINLENCTALGTVTATGSSLNLSNCKYLRYCNVYNTNLTEVQLNTSGGSLTEIYYPKSIQSINLVKQRLLEIIGLPYGVGGSEIPTSLYTISIQECPSIKKLNTSSNEDIASSFASMVYANNLTIRNSLDLASLNFDGFHRLQNVIIENMYNLEEVGFNNLLPVGETSTIKYIGMSNCPKLGTIELNCTSDDYEITFADDAILNFGGLFKLNSITSNCVLKGIKTIIVPINLESMFFTNEYGSGYSTIENIWVSSQCNVDTQATTPIVTHVDSTYSGIDFLGMNLKNIDLGALVNIPKAINFSLSPTTVNPHFNLNRDGETYRYLQPVGTLDLSNYTESLARFFDGVDLDKLEIICNNKLPQTDLSYCFYNSTFSTNDAINKLLTKVSSITNLDYCFYRTTINSTDILDEINMGESSSMNYTFAECPNIKTLNNVVIPNNVTSVEGMFNKCPLTTITNMIVNVRGSISGLFKGCNKLTTINTLRIPNVTDVSGTFDGCTNLSSLSGFELPDSCTNVSNLFNGCYMLTELGMDFGSNITAGDNWYPPNLERLYDTEISNDKVKLTNCTTLKTLNNVNISGGDLSDLFNGCTNLATVSNCTFNATTSLARAFKGCAKLTVNPITTIVDTVTDISEMYSGCTGITDISGMTFGSGITNVTDWCKDCPITTANNVTIKNNLIKFTDCTTLTKCLNLDVSNVTNMKDYFSNCSNLTNISLYPPSSTCDMFSLCYKCSSLVSIECLGSNKMKPTSLFNSFRDIGTQFNYEFTSDKWDFSNCQNMTYMFYGDSDVNINMSGANLTAITANTQPFFHPASVDFTGSTFNFTHLVTTKVHTFFVTVHNVVLDDCTISGNLKGQFNYGTDINHNLRTVSMNNVTLLDDAAKDWSNIFYNCTVLTSIVGLDTSNLSGVTNMSGAFMNCPNITQLPFTTIPDSVTNIDSLFSGTGITDISGLTIGRGVTSATDWIKDCPITTANNVTIKNNFAKFTNCTSLSSCDNLTIAEGVTSLENLLYKCTSLTSLLGFRIPDTVTDIHQMLYECDNLTDISGMTFGSGITRTTNWCNNSWSPIYANNITIKNDVVNFYNKRRLKECKNLSRPNSTDWTSFFGGCTSLLEDIVFPQNTTNVTNCFKGCTGMTHVHSNWKKSYTNGITSTDCYAGCTGITHVDNENVITSEYVEGLDEIPEAWGGYGFSIDDTAIITIEIPENKLTFELIGVSSNLTTNPYPKISWGDGTSSVSERIHTYSSPGNYIVKVRFDSAVIPSGYAMNVYYYPTDSTTTVGMRDALTKVIQVPINTKISGDHFRQCSKLKTLNLDRAIIKSKYLCYWCSELERVDLTNCTIESLAEGTEGWAWRQTNKLTTINLAGSTIYDGNCFFYAATALTTILGLDTADFSHNTNVYRMFRDCYSLVNIPPLRTLLAPGTKPRDLNNLYIQCSAVTTIDIRGVDFSETTNMEGMFYQNTNLTNIIGLNDVDFSKVVNLKSTFHGTRNLAIPIDLSNVNRSEPVVMESAFFQCGATSVTGLSGIKLSGVVRKTFQEMNNLTSLDVSGIDTSGVTDFGTAWAAYIHNCPNIETVDLSNLDTSGSNGSIYDLCRGMPKLKSLVSKNANVSNLTGLGTFLFDCQELVDLDLESWDISNVTSFGSFVRNSSKLTNFKSFKNINCDMNFSWCNQLTVESLMSIINALKSTTETKTLTLGSANLAKLSSAQIKVGTDKGWTIA